MDSLSLTDILNHFQYDVNAFRRIEDKFKSGRVLNFRLDCHGFSENLMSSKIFLSLIVKGGVV